MTTLEIVLSSVSGLAVTVFGAKKLWEYLISRDSNLTKIKMTRLQKDEDDIRSLQDKYQILEGKYKIIEMQNAQMATSFKILLPLLKKLAEGNESVSEAIKVVEDFLITDNDD